MSTRKSTLASPTSQGTKAENAAASLSTTSTNTSITKTLDSKTNTSSSVADKLEMGANASNANNNNTIKEQQQETKPFLQRVTRNSPLLLVSPGVTIKKEPIDPSEPTNSESEEAGGISATGKKIIRGRKFLKETKDLTEQDKEKEEPDTKEKEKEELEKTIKDNKDSLHTKEQNDNKEHTETKDNKDTSNPSSTSSPVTASSSSTSNRLTRKSVANQEAASTSTTNTRITRQRQSSGASARSETPPARSRSGRAIGRVKMPVPMIEPTPMAKRKRSVDNENATATTTKTSTDEPGPKYIKIEVKDPDLDHNDEILQSSQGTTASSEVEDSCIKIKQELLDESENEMHTNNEIVNITTTTSSTTSTTTTTRGKGRYGIRKSTTTNANAAPNTSTNSPSTRATRQTKQTSPVQTNVSKTSSIMESKRRRMGSQTRSLHKTNVTEDNTTKTQPSKADEEDSKDSTASSTNTDDIVLALIKSEKISMDMDEDTNDTKDLAAASEVTTEKMETIANKPFEGTKDLPPPLMVDTTEETQTTNTENTEILTTIAALTPAAASCSSLASGSEKAASLSPSELVSEGVSEISVKQFYKKPKFLENNLGIEEDPKLGNIVQKVAGMDTAATTPSSIPSTTNNSPITTETLVIEDRLLDDSYSNESLKEGALRFEESMDEKKSSSQEDGSSLSSGGNITPLLLVDDDSDVDEENFIKNKEVAEGQDKGESSKEQRDNATVTPKEIVEIPNEISLEKEIPTIDIIDAEADEVDEEPEDELTLEESETISMDNNASINDEITTEIEDPPNEDDLADIEDVTEVIENISDKGNEKVKTVETTTTNVENKTAILEVLTTKIIEESPAKLETKVEEILPPTLNKTEDAKIVIINNDEKENQESNINISTHAASSSSLLISSDEYENNDVLAKIDAELKKIDEHELKIKLNATVIKEEEIVPDLDSSQACEEDITKESLDEFIIPNSVMEVDDDDVDDIKLSPDDAKNITKDDVIIDDVLDINLDDEQPLIIAEDITLIEDKIDTEENLKISLKDEKLEMDKIQLKTLPSDIGIDIVNGKPTPTSSTSSSPVKTGQTLTKDDDTTSMKSGQSTTSWITLDLENDDEETLKKKELHLKNLGLVTHKAAEKRRLEVIQSSAANVEASKAATQQQQNKRNGKNSSHAASTHHEYTGTLKTIIKINRNSTGGSANAGNGRKTQNNTGGGSSSTSSSKEQQHQRRQSLKMTFQKGRGRAHGTGNNDRSQHDRESHGEDSYYTIQNETEGALKKIHNYPTTTTTSITRLALTHTNNYNNLKYSSTTTTTYARKSYNYRNYQHHSSSATNAAHIYQLDSSNSESHDQQAGVLSKKDEKEEILIPEKASSFKFHPGRLCEDQCFYCSGKFGLYDTPCHVGQIKSMERQQKILKNEEKLTVDNCLCDACFRHVDRRANVPSYKKRLSAPGHLDSMASTSSMKLSEQHYDDHQQNQTEADGGGHNLSTNTTSRKCLVPDCVHPAAHSLRRKCIRKSVKKFLLKFEIPTSAASVWLCQTHYDTVIQCSGCVLCKRRLGKNHMYHITSDTDRLEKSLCEMGIPVQLGIGTAVCKLCRYFANLLMKPPDSTKSQKAEFVKNYRKRLLQFHNIHDGSNEASEADEDDNSNSNSATNQEQQQKIAQKSNLQQEDDLSSNKKDTPSHSVDPLGDEQTNSNNSNQLLENKTDTMERDFETAGISTDSSNSSASNTASNSPNEMSKLKAILQSNASAEKQKPSADISNVLRANPNISMRELFPGEEDLGLQFKVPFGSSTSQRTPEGWTRVQTFLQYDEPTRRLWEELQKPYGNQSSFLRHLILLEKYFRNGDLVLSASASNNASVYTQTVKQRLTSYDKGHCGGLHMGTGTPKDNNTTITKLKESEQTSPQPQIPTFEINEDDDEEDDSEDQDVEISEVIQKYSSTQQQDNTTSNQNKKLQLARSRSLSVDKLTKQLSSNAVTITARPKESSSSNSKRATPSPQKSLLKDNLTTANNTSSSSSSTTTANLAAANAAAAIALAASTASTSGSSNSRSILKCNLLGINKSVEILPINSTSTTTITKTPINNNNNNNPPPPPPPPPPAPILPAAETKQQKILEVANKLLGNQFEATQQNKNQISLLSSPPELVSLQRRSTGGGQAPVAMPPNTAATVNTHTQPATSNINKRPQLLAGKPGTSRPPPNVVILPDTLTPQERLQSKTWRPTLMPVQENQNLLNKNGPLYQTADGRRLPALVQVQSGGKPFLISIFDYNRMCILRREKLMRDQMLKATKKRQEAKQQQQQQQAQAQHQQQQAQAQHQQQQQQQHQQQQQQQQQHHQQQQLLQNQQQQFQKTNLQNIQKNFQSNPNLNQQQRQQQHQVAQQQLLQLQLLQHQQALFKAAAAANNSANSQQATQRFQSIAPKPPATSNITTMPLLQPPINTNANFPAPMMPLLANAITNAANTGNINPASSSSTSAALNNTSWLWNNFPDANQLLLNGAAGPGGANVPKLPQLLGKPNPNNNPAATLTSVNNAMKQQHQQQQQQQQQYLLSKIPKSLTVIPQHKLINSATASGGNTSGNPMKE